MKNFLKISFAIFLLFGLIGCGGGGGGATGNENYAGGASGTGVGTRVEVQGEFTTASGQAIAGATVEDTIGGGSAVTNDVGFYSLFAQPDANFELQLRIRNTNTANEETISLPVQADTQGAQVDVIDQGEGAGFDFKFEVFTSEDTFDFGGGFSAPNDGGGGTSSGGGDSSTEEFLANGNGSGGESNAEAGQKEQDTDAQIDADSFEAEFNAKRGGGK